MRTRVLLRLVYALKRGRCDLFRDFMSVGYVQFGTKSRRDPVAVLWLDLGAKRLHTRTHLLWDCEAFGCVRCAVVSVVVCIPSQLGVGATGCGGASAPCTPRGERTLVECQLTPVFRHQRLTCKPRCLLRGCACVCFVVPCSAATMSKTEEPSEGKKASSRSSSSVTDFAIGDRVIVNNKAVGVRGVPPCWTAISCLELLLLCAATRLRCKHLGWLVFVCVECVGNTV